MLFGAHPLFATRLHGYGAWIEPAGTALGLVAGVLLARTPREPRLLWPSLVAYAASLPLAPGAAAIPFLVAAAIVGYHGLDPARLLTKRLLPRFAAFLVPLVAWIVWALVRGDAASYGIGVVPTFLARAALPFGSYDAGGAVLGAGLTAACLAVGLARLRAAPKAAWPLLALGASLVAMALMPAVSPSFTAALAFAALFVAEGIEELFYRFGAIVAMPLTLVVYVALAVQSHITAR